MTFIGPPPPPTVIVVHIFVLLAGLGSCGVAVLLPCDTVAQFVNVPPCGTLKERRMVPDWPGVREVAAAVHVTGALVTGPAAEQPTGRLPPAPVYKVPGGTTVTVSVKLSGATDGTVPMLVTVIVQSTDCCPLIAHVFVTLKSGPTACAVNGIRNIAAPISGKSRFIK